MINADCHIHTFYQRCGNETMTVPNIIRRAEAAGLKKIAITDHLNNFDRLDAFRYIKSDIEAVETEIEVFFGVELNYLDRGGEFAYNKKIHGDFGFEVVVGGIHSAYTDSMDKKAVLEIQHEHYMKTFKNPLVDVLVHPFWFSKSEIQSRPAEFWEELLLSVPDDFIEEWADASVRYNCAIEVNASGIFYHPSCSDKFKRAYVEFLRRLKDKKAVFSVCSDAHDINSIGRSYHAEGVLFGLDVPEEQIWTPVKT